MGLSSLQPFSPVFDLAACLVLPMLHCPHCSKLPSTMPAARPLPARAPVTLSIEPAVLPAQFLKLLEVPFFHPPLDFATNNGHVTGKTQLQYRQQGSRPPPFRLEH